jgi:dynein heavy chain
MVCVQPPSEQCLRTIFGGILGGFLQLFPSECKAFLKPVVDSTIEVYMRISQELLPTPAKSHYTFNLRDVSKVFQVSNLLLVVSKIIIRERSVNPRV